MATGLVLAAVLPAGCSGDQADAKLSEFAREVDLTPLASVAVQEMGRLKSFDSFCRGAMSNISGSRLINGQDPAFTYFDMLLRPQAYADEAVIFVKKKNIRQEIVESLRKSNVDKKRLEQFFDTGLISRTILQQPAVMRKLEAMSKDLMRTAGPVNELMGAVNMAEPESLSFGLRVIPAPSGDPKADWHSIDELSGASGAPQDSAHAGVNRPAIEGLSPELSEKLAASWNTLSSAWIKQDSAAASKALADFAALLPTVSPKLYPDADRMKLESWYFRTKNMTWVWLIYLAAIVPLLISVIYRWRGARILGAAMFLTAFGFHTAAVMIRWYVADRWPNSNMFEAVTTSAWFCGAATLIIELLVRRTLLSNLFFLASSVASMAALMAGRFLPLQLNPAIGNMMPVLHDIWLYIHTNVIIFSYALIAAAAVSAIMYLVYRAFGGDKKVAKAGGAGSLIMAGGSDNAFLREQSKVSFGQVVDVSTMMLMELSFVLLWAGLVMGAIWADHSWGRPWGWDPKEVFALNTFIIFLLLVHVRFKVRDKGLWTAVLAVVGCGVMLFNWIVVNFVITGLHSYA